MKFYLCVALLVAPTMASPQGDALCPFPYKQVFDECFYLSTIKLTWKKAREYCQNLQGDLASPTNVYAIHAYLHTLNFKQHPFLGATNAKGTKKWVWLDGREIKANNWGRNQPNIGGAEHCVAMEYSDVPPLHDYPCEGKRPFVCQYSP